MGFQMRVSDLVKIIGIIILTMLLSFCFMPGYALEESNSFDDLPIDEAILNASEKEAEDDNDGFEAEYLPEENESNNLNSEDGGTDTYSLSFSYDETVPVNAPDLDSSVEVKAGEKVHVDEESVLEDYASQGWQLNGVPVSNDVEMPEEGIELIGTWSDYMPPGSALVESYNGIVASASWERGVFYDGTELLIEEKSQAYANEIGRLALGDDIQIIDSVAVDISFINREKDLYNLQPYDNSIVHIELALPNALQGDKFSLIHQKSGGG
ncbi:MAG: hypothetical protein J6Y57_11205 [Lachnospiraceae bacterium]|nr:hypothetical protein [Lachnospiraceae bacterium]